MNTQHAIHILKLITYNSGIITIYFFANYWILHYVIVSRIFLNGNETVGSTMSKPSITKSKPNALSSPPPVKPVENPYNNPLPNTNNMNKDGAKHIINHIINIAIYS